MAMVRVKRERGFVLVTAIVMLGLLSLLSIGMFMTGKSATQTSATARNSTEGYYYAETGLNYITWALANDAELDGFDPTNTPPNASSVGDWSELKANLSDPGGQLRYFDNQPLKKRGVNWQQSNPTQPVLADVRTKLPGYIRLDISNQGAVTPSLVSPVSAAKSEIPNNGAIIWMTTGNAAMDFEVDPAIAACGPSNTAPADFLACDKNSGVWLRMGGVKSDQSDQHAIAIYAIGYVNGKPRHLLRSVIGVQ